MPQWIHDRADHILSKNPSMPKGEAFALATQQAHAVGKSPKGYGTSEGRATAKAKYPTPGDDKKTAAVYAAFNDELLRYAQGKEAGLLDAAKRFALTDVGGPPGLLQSMGAAAANTAKKRLGSFAPQATQRLVSGAHDVSGLAARMGI